MIKNTGLEPKSVLLSILTLSFKNYVAVGNRQNIFYVLKWNKWSGFEVVK